MQVSESEWTQITAKHPENKYRRCTPGRIWFDSRWKSPAAKEQKPQLRTSLSSFCGIGSMPTQDYTGLAALRDSWLLGLEDGTVNYWVRPFVSKRMWQTARLSCADSAVEPKSAENQDRNAD